MKIFPVIKPIVEFRQFIEQGGWDEKLLKYEKYLDRFSWAVIIAAALYFAPVCINIFIR